MTTTNSYKDTKAIDYLEAIKRNQLESRNSKSSSSNFDMTYSLPMTSSVGVATSFTNTEKTIGDYDVVDNTGKLVAYLPMDYDTLDASNSNDGTITGTETYVDGPEISSTHPLRKAFSFNGSTYITLANESNFDFDKTDPFSTSFWINPNSSITDIDTIFSKDSNINNPSSAGYGSTFRTTNPHIDFRIQDGTTAYIVISSDNSTPYDKWTFIVLTKGSSANQDAMKIYINGVLDATGSTSTINNSILNNISFIIGSAGAARYFDGYITKFQVWNVELSSSDVTDLYAGKQINKDTPAKPAYLGASDVA